MRTLHHKCDRCGDENETVLRFEIALRCVDERRSRGDSIHEETLTLCQFCVEAAADEMVLLRDTIKRRWERANER